MNPIIDDFIQAISKLPKPDQDEALRLLAEEIRGEVGAELMRLACTWTAIPGPQTEALRNLAKTIFYGGGAGSGKSNLLLGAALTQHTISIIFRREYPQLRSLIDEAMKIALTQHSLTPDLPEPYFSSSTNRIKNLPDNRIVEFGACQYDRDTQRYQGRARDLTGIDEVSNFTQAQIRFLTGWTRTELPNQRVRNLFTGNPPTTMEGEWVIEYFAPWLDPSHANPALSGEIRWFVVIKGEDIEVEDETPVIYDRETIYPQSRTFIRAKITDNPYLMRSGYLETLQALPEPLRSQMLHGSFTIGREDSQWQMVPTAWLLMAESRHNSMEQPPHLTHVGVDPARGGADQTVICRRYSNYIAPFIVLEGSTTPDANAVVHEVVKAVFGENQAQMIVDAIGVGASVYDTLRNFSDNPHWRSRIQPFQASEAAKWPDGRKLTDSTGQLTFRNLRAAAYWYLRECLDPNNPDAIALPPDRVLRSELCSIQWSLTSGGIQVESKDDLRKRLGRSTDRADALAMAMWDARRLVGTGYSSTFGDRGSVATPTPTTLGLPFLR